VHALEASGFQNEGLIRDHAVIGGKPCDLAVLGVLRAEFEVWCRENETRLAL
jgi:RimJ/RimL family protein N-acetyltransferase